MRQLKLRKSITNRDSEAVEKYLQEITNMDLITPDDEIKLAVRIKKGDQLAIEKLAKANLRFVVSVAKQYQHQGLALADLINEGNIGLITAVHKYDETKGFKFISYAVWWIRQAIIKALAETGRLVRLPQNRLTLRTDVDRKIMTFEQMHEREPSVEEIAEIMLLEEDEIKNILQTHQKHDSLSHTVDEDQTVESGDLFKGDLSSDEDVIYSSLRDDIALSLKSLSPREYDIVVAFYGLNGHESQTAESIANNTNLSKERVRQLILTSINRLRNPIFSNNLRQYLG